MANNRRSRQEMQKVYFRRRVGAIVILVLILLFVFNRCRSKPIDEEVNTDTNTDNNQTYVIPDDNPNNSLDPLESNDLDRENNLDDELDLETTDDENEFQTADIAITRQIKDMEDIFRRDADIFYDEDTESISFEIKGSLKDSVDRIFEDNGETSDYERWDEFKSLVVESSETISENVETGITLKAINVGGPTESILSVKDGIQTFDLVEE